MNVATLRTAGRRPPVPASLALQSGGQLTVERWLRILPGKRLTGIAHWQEQRVVAKLFVAARHPERHWQREHDGVRQLEKSSLPSPPLLDAGQIVGGGYYLLFPYLADAREPVPDSAEDLKRVVSLLGCLHACGLKQEDAHLGNFLLKDEETFVIDGDAVRNLHSPQECIDNLALLLAQLSPENELAMRAGLLATYRTCNPGCTIDDARLGAGITQSRERRLNDYLKKCLRDCSLFQVSRSMNRFVSTVRSEADWLAPVIADPDRWLEQGIPLKQGRTATLARVDVGGHQIVIKRYNIKGAGHALSRAWRPSRAWHSWLEGHRLSFLGITTPRPLALIETRLGPLRSTAWLITEYCGGENLSVINPDIPPGEVVVAIGRLFALMHDACISHGDLKATNLIWHAGEICLIDLDSMQQHESATGYARAWWKDRERLLGNWSKESPLHAAISAVLPPG